MARARGGYPVIIHNGIHLKSLMNTIMNEFDIVVAFPIAIAEEKIGTTLSGILDPPLQLQPTSISLRTYTGEDIEVLGQLSVDVYEDEHESALHF